MSVKEIVCIMCPLGCKLEVTIGGEDITKVEGYRCKQGIEYARQEAWAPCRILTTTIRTDNPESPLIPVRSDSAIPKDKLEDSMRVISRQLVKVPIKMGEVIVDDILSTGANIIASRSMLATPRPSIKESSGVDS